MKFVRPSGIEADIPSTYEVDDLGPIGAEPWRRAAALSGDYEAPRFLAEVIIEALREHEFVYIDELLLRSSKQAPLENGARGRSTTDAGPPAAYITVPLADEDDAVILVEREKMFSWVFPADPTDETRRHRAVGRGRKTRSFIIDLPPQWAATIPRRGPFGNLFPWQLRVIIFRFVACAAAENVITFFERNVATEIISMRGDLHEWAPAVQTEASESRSGALRVLLFLHGAFSSSRGSFGGLGITGPGRDLLARAAIAYDQVIGFDHPTLSVDPGSNADDLLMELDKIAGGQPLQIDVIGHSRGGLVYRALMKRLAERPRFSVGKICFVAVPNEGTHLAEAKNWHRLLELYTNMAIASLRLVQFLPGATSVSIMGKEAICSLGAFIRYLASYTLSDTAIPGLAAMRPNSQFLSSLLPPKALEEARFAVVSSFEAPGLNDADGAGLPRQVLRNVADGIVDQLLGTDNDLVVNKSSMTSFGEGAQYAIDQVLDFGATSQVYHTNYFIREEVTNALSQWFGLAEKLDLETSGRRGAINKEPQPLLPVYETTNIAIVGYTDRLRHILDMAYGGAPEFVVVRRSHSGRILNYAFRPSEIISFVGERPLADLLQLLETDTSTEIVGLEHNYRPPVRRRRHPSASRGILIDGGEPSSVIYSDPKKLIPPEGEGTLYGYGYGYGYDYGGGPPLGDTAPGPGPAPSDNRYKHRFLAPPAGRRAGGLRAGGLLVSSGDIDEAPEPSIPDDVTPVPSRVVCHFLAELDHEVPVARPATLSVTISRDLIEPATDKASSSGSSGLVDVGVMLIVEIWARRNLKISGESRVEVKVPAKGDPEFTYFDVIASKPGPAEVMVVIRQGVFPLTRLDLKVTAVEQVSEDVAPLQAEAVGTTTDRPPTPINQLRIFDTEDDGRLRFFYELSLPGITLQRFQSDEIKGDRTSYVEKIYHEIENRYVESKQEDEEFRILLKAMGGQLFNELFPLRLQTLLWKYKHYIKTIQVISTEPFIPWELVYLKNPDEKGLPKESKFLAELGLTRWVHGSWHPPRVTVRSGRAYYVAPEYADSTHSLPEAPAEIAFVERRLRAQSLRPALKEIYSLLQNGFDLLHFVCHGVAEQSNISNAALELSVRSRDGGGWETNELKSVVVEELGKLGDTDGNRPLVVLNACQSGREGLQLTGVGGFAQAFLSAGAGMFVGTLWSVVDKPARVFVETLYEALIEGRTLGEAATEARAASSRIEASSWLAYAVYGDPHGRLVLVT
jgi:pimeloyl-ACP methyl ester carboxylesterase